VIDAPIYLDSSALLKLVFEEPETRELERFVATWRKRAASALARVEVLRIARRVDDDLVERHARDLIDRLHLIYPDRSLFSVAAIVAPPSLRSLDAIHLATALSLQPDLAGMVVYDQRLADAARAAGLTVWAPA
jgi:predicted nucleic acid-binding protein